MSTTDRHIGTPTDDLDGVDLDWPASTAPSDAEARTIAALHARLEHAAALAGALDVGYTGIDTPVGRLLLAGTERGLVRVVFDNEDHNAVLDALATRLSPRILETPGGFDDVRRQFDDYFAGSRTAFDVPLDLSLSRGFRLLVQRHLPDIAYGKTESYKRVAEAVGNPRAVRAVGTACATNPLPIVVPCHRVLRTDGSLGGYIGGLERKTALLAHESGAASW